MTDRQEEEFLIRSLSADIGCRPAVPDDSAERWRLLRSLMNVRPPLPASQEVLSAQDDYLRRLRTRRGTVPCDGLEFHDGICLWQGDITRLECDAIVNAANSAMLGCFCPCHGCIDNAIHTYAGMQLRLECDGIMRGSTEPPGRAMVTSGYNLPCRHVIHTVGPIVHGRPDRGDAETLRSCYRSCLDAAASVGARTVAFCCISTGEFGYPNRPAAEIAVDEVRAYLGENHGMRVVFDVFKDVDLGIYGELLG